jgi:hypothetical protein
MLDFKAHVGSNQVPMYLGRPTYLPMKVVRAMMFGKFFTKFQPEKYAFNLLYKAIFMEKVAQIHLI